MGKIKDIFDNTRIDYEGVFEPKAEMQIKEMLLDIVDELEVPGQTESVISSEELRQKIRNEL